MIEKDSLLNQIVQAHLAFKTFRCRTTLRRIIQTDVTIESQFSMHLAFSRPRNMFLQWWLDGHHDRKHRVVLATDALVIEHSFGDLEWKQRQSIEDVLAIHAGISSGLSLHIPSLLLGWQEYTLFALVEGVDRTSDQTSEDYLLSGFGSADIVLAVKVRASDFVILSMKEQFTIPTGHVVCESQYTDIEVSST